MAPTHWQQHLDHWGVADYFDWTLVSYELNTIKPEPKAYQDAINATGLEPDQILFLDDARENVIAARSQGLRAEHTRGIAEARAAISDHFPTLT